MIHISPRGEPLDEESPRAAHECHNASNGSLDIDAELSCPRRDLNMCLISGAARRTDRHSLKRNQCIFTEMLYGSVIIINLNNKKLINLYIYITVSLQV